jgi:RNA polymerase sigma-70 factor (ECF subfamily)
MLDVCDRFLLRLEPSRRSDFSSLADLEARLRRLLDDARAAHPGVLLDDALFTDALADRVEDDLGAIHASDLYLALACASGLAAGLAAFDRLYGAELDVAIARSPGLGVSRQEFRQLVRTRLFVSEADRPARIAQYSARGPLAAWVRVTAARIVVDLSRAPGEPELLADEAMLDRLTSPDDPATVLLRTSYAGHVQAAFREGLARLSTRQRNLLRQRYLHGLSADKLAPAYAVHRTTAFGWLEDARRSLLAHVRDALRERLPGSELESVVGVLGSRLEISVRSALGGALEDERPDKVT